MAYDFRNPTYVTPEVLKAFKALKGKALKAEDWDLFNSVQHALNHDGHNPATKADFEKCLKLI